MVDISDKEAGYNSGGSDTESSQHQAIFEHPTGLKGVYYHPITQVFMSLSSFYPSLIRGIASGVHARLRLLHVSRSVF